MASSRFALCTALLLAACGSSHETDAGSGTDARPGSDSGIGGFAGSFIGDECAPDDGAALTIVLYTVAVRECSADMSVPSSRFYFFEGSSRFFPIEAPETITSTTASGGFGNGSAQYCPSGGTCTSSNEWTLTFDTFVRDSGASGSYTIDFEDGTSTSGTFDATWCRFMPPLCG